MQVNSDQSQVITPTPISQPDVQAQQTPVPQDGGGKNPAQTQQQPVNGDKSQQPPKPGDFKKLIKDAYHAVGYDIDDDNVSSLANHYSKDPSQFVADFWKENGKELHPTQIANIYNNYFSKSTEKPTLISKDRGNPAIRRNDIARYEPKPNTPQPPSLIAGYSDKVSEMKNNGTPFSDAVIQGTSNNTDNNFDINNNLTSKQPGFERDVNNALIDQHYKPNDGEWGNALQHIKNSITQSATSAVTALSGLARNSTGTNLPALYDGKGNLSEYGKSIDNENGLSIDPIGKFIMTLNGAKNAENEEDANKPLPDTFLGNTASGFIGVAPDIAMTAAFPEGEVADGAGAISRLKSAIWNPFTKLLTIKGGINGYNNAIEHGETPDGQLKDTALGAIGGTVNGGTLGLLGGLGGGVTEPVMNSLGKLGLIKSGSTALTKAGIKAGADATLFAALPLATAGGTSIVNKLLSAKDDPDMWEKAKKEAESGVGMALGFGLLDAFHGVKTDALNKAKVKDIYGDRSVIALNNFMVADPDAILESYHTPTATGDMNAQAVTYADKSMKEHDQDKKDQLILTAQTFAKASDVKGVTQAILNDKDGFIKSIEGAKIPDALKQSIIDKANLIHDKVLDSEQKPTDDNSTTSTNTPTTTQEAPVVMSKKTGRPKKVATPVVTDNSGNSSALPDRVIDSNGTIHDNIVGIGDNGGYLNEYGTEVHGEAVHTPVVKNKIKNGEINPVVESVHVTENKKAKAVKNLTPSGAEHISNPLNDKLIDLGYSENDFTKLSDDQKQYIIDNKIQKPVEKNPVESHKKKVADIFSTIGIQNPEIHAENAVGQDGVQNNETFMNHEQPENSEQVTNNIADEKASTDAEGQTVNEAGRQDGQEVGNKGRKQKRPGSRQKNDETVSPESRQEGGNQEEVVDHTQSGIPDGKSPESVPDKVHFTRENVKTTAMSKPEKGHIDSSDLDDKGKLQKKQTIQLVLKKKFNELRTAKPEDFQAALHDFVSRVMDYRRRGFIKGETSYTEKGSKDTFNGVNHWIDSVEGLVDSKINGGKGNAQRIVHEAQAEWAKKIDLEERGGKIYNQRLQELGLDKGEQEPVTAPVEREEPAKEVGSEPVATDEQQPATEQDNGVAAVPEPIGKEADSEDLPDEVEEKDTTPADNYYKADEDAATPDAPKDNEIKDDVDTRLVHVGDDDNGKPIKVRAEDIELYNKTIDLINLKLQRIDEAKEQIDNAKEQGDKAKEQEYKAAQQRHEGSLKSQKDKLQQIIADAKNPPKKLIEKDASENKTIVNNLKAQKQNIEDATFLDKAERIANGLHEKGSKNLRKARNDMASGGLTSDLIKGASQKIAAHLIDRGVSALKTVNALKKYIKEMVLSGKLTHDPLEGSTKDEQNNVIKLVNDHLSAHHSNERSRAEKANKFIEDNRKEAKRLENENHGLTRWGAFKRNFTDRSANLTEALKKYGGDKINPSSPISESYGDRATRLFYAMSGSGNKALEMYHDAYKNIYGSSLLGGKHFLGEKEQHVLSLIINMRRIAELDRLQLERNPGKPMLQHPGDYNREMALKTLRDLEQKTPEMVKQFGNYDFNDINQRAESYFGVMQKLLDMRHDAGLISKASYETMKEAKYYSPRRFLQYLDNDIGYNGKVISTGNTVRKLDGGSNSEVIDNPARLMHDAIQLVHRNVDQNETYKAMNAMFTNIDTEIGRPAKYSGSFMSALKKHYEDKEAAANLPTSHLFGVQNEIDPTIGWKFIKPEFESPKDGERLFTYYDNGVQKGFIMKNVYGDELAGFQNKWPRRMLSLWTGARLKQALATGINTWFAISNTIRDAGFVLFTTNHYSNIFPVAAAQYGKDWVSALKDAWAKGGSYEDFIKQGGGREFSNGDPQLFSGDEKQWKSALNEIWYQLGHRLPQTSEIAGRLAVRNRVIKNLTDQAVKSGVEITPEVKKDIEFRATGEASNTMDFSQGGIWPKEINSIIPFFNAGILGTRNMFRYAKENPKVFTAKLLQLAAANAALAAWNNSLGMFNSDDDKERADYYNRYISDNDKSVNHIVMLPFPYTDEKGIKRYPYLKIPKPQEQKLFSGLFEHLTLKANGIEDDYTKSRVKQDAVSLASYIPDGGNFLPSLLYGPVTYLSNHDFFRGKDLYKGPDVLPEDQYDAEKTPKSWINIGSALGMSPSKLKGAFEATVPTNNQIFDMVNFAADHMGLGSRSTERDMETKKSFTDQLESGDKNDLHRLIVETLNKGGGKRLMGVTTDSPIDANTKNIVLQGNSDKKIINDTFQDYIKRYEEGKTNGHPMTDDDLEEAAKAVGSDPSIGADGQADVVNLMYKAKIAIKGQDATQYAKELRLTSRDPKIQAELYLDQMSKVADPDKKAEYLKQIDESNLFDKKFHYWLEVLQSEQKK